MRLLDNFKRVYYRHWLASCMILVFGPALLFCILCSVFQDKPKLYHMEKQLVEESISEPVYINLKIRIISGDVDEILVRCNNTIEYNKFMDYIKRESDLLGHIGRETTTLKFEYYNGMKFNGIPTNKLITKNISNVIGIEWYRLN